MTDPYERYRRARDAGLSHEEATAAAQQPEGDPGLLSSGLARSAAQGATFGFADELEAIGRGLFPGGADYNEALHDARADVAEYREAHPIAALAGEFAGGVATAGGAGGLLKLAGSRGVAPATRLLRGIRDAVRTKPVRTAATASGLSGAAYAAGASETPEIADGERARALLPGGVFGAAGGAVLGPAAGKLGTVARDVLGARGQRGVRTRAADILTDRIQTGVGAGSADEALDAVASEARRLRGPATVAEATVRDGQQSPSVLRLVRAVEAKGGEGGDVVRRKLQGRQAGQAHRLLEGVQEVSGGEIDDVDGLLEQMTAAQRARAKPLYDEAYAFGAVDDPEVARLVNEPEFQRAYDRARRIIKLRDEVDLPALDEGPPTLEALDRMKRALDRQIRLGGASRDQINVDEAMALRERLNRVLGRLDEQVPAYGQARSTWSGDEAAKEALEAGFRFDREAPEAVARQLERMSDTEQMAYRLGALRNLRETLLEKGGHLDAVRRLTGAADEQLWSPDDVDRLRSIFPSREAFEDFRSLLSSEGRMFNTKSVLGNSQTARIQEDVARLDNETAEAVLQAVEDPKGMLGRGLRRLGRSRLHGFNDRTVGELADMLTAGVDNPTDLNALIDELRKRAGDRATESAARNTAAGFATGVLGGREG